MARHDMFDDRQAEARSALGPARAGVHPVEAFGETRKMFWRDPRPVILHAPSSRQRKGTEQVIAAYEGLDADLVLVEGLHHAEAFERYRDADIVVDQLNAGWYGLFAIECMALGKPVITFLHDEAVRRTEEAFGVSVPIVRATKEDLRARLEPLVASAAERRRIGEASRAYVERVHDLDRVADRLLDLYARL